MQMAHHNVLWEPSAAIKVSMAKHVLKSPWISKISTVSVRQDIMERNASVSAMLPLPVMAEVIVTKMESVIAVSDSRVTTAACVR